VNPHQIILRPVISEKTVHQQSKLNQYTFAVHPDANKVQIAEAVEALFKVKVDRVNTVNCRGKDRRMRSRITGTEAAWKKAIVKLAEGQKIEGV
jgi:large subunit ribosomal protein L23